MRALIRCAPTVDINKVEVCFEMRAKVKWFAPKIDVNKVEKQSLKFALKLSKAMFVLALLHSLCSLVYLHYNVSVACV